MPLLRRSLVVLWEWGVWLVVHDTAFGGSVAVLGLFSGCGLFGFGGFDLFTSDVSKGSIGEIFLNNILRQGQRAHIVKKDMSILCEGQTPCYASSVDPKS